jgi:hypothetical protein
MVDKRVNQNENHMDVFALYPHTMPVSILSSWFRIEGEDEAPNGVGDATS